MFCPKCGTLSFPDPSGKITCPNYKCGYVGPAKLVIKGTDGEDVDLFRRIRKFGKTSIFNLVNIYESPRRYRKLGYINVLFLWFMNWLFIIIFKKTFSSKW